MYGAVLLTLLDTVAELKDAALAADAFDQLIAVPGWWVGDMEKSGLAKVWRGSVLTNGCLLIQRETACYVYTT